MHNYLTANTFREKIFRLRINEETFNVIKIIPSIFDRYSGISVLGHDDSENIMCLNQ